MSETVLRRAYRDSRVLIDAARVLDPQFDDDVLTLTGAQIEMLRNLTQYLNRRDTFVDEYHEQYYLIPDDADWDSLQQVIADLEDVLMGNPNVVFGYGDVWGDAEAALDVDAGNATINYDVVTNGKIIVVTNFSVIPWQANVRSLELRVVVDGTSVTLKSETAVVAYKSVDIQCNIILKAGDRLAFRYDAAAAGDDFVSHACGYAMEI